MCKIVFSITFNVSFWCSKEPSHREDSFEHQKCLSENIIVDLRIISKLTSKLNIKTFEWHFVGGPMWVRHYVLADTVGWQFLKRKSPQTFSLCSAFEPF